MWAPQVVRERAVGHARAVVDLTSLVPRRGPSVRCAIERVTCRRLSGACTTLPAPQRWGASMAYERPGTPPAPLRTILHVTECYEGGVGRAIRNIVRILPDDVHLLLARGSGIGTDAHLYACVTALPDGPLSALVAVQKVTRRLSPDLLHAHSSWAGIYTRLLPLPVPVVYEPHCYAFEDTNRGRVFRSLFWLAEYWASRRTASVLTLSPREALLARRVSASTPIYYLPNAPTLPVVPPAIALDKTFTQSMCMIGRAAAQKDPGYFVRVADEVRRHVPNVECTWIGGGEPGYIELLESSGIRVTGWLEPAEVARELDHAGVYVHSALYEGFPLSVLDAASQGVPVIARDIPCFNDTPLVRGQAPQDVAEKAIAALTDPQTRLSVINRGYALLEHMNEANQMNALEHAYTECLSR